jgi:hypothetical protein
MIFPPLSEPTCPIIVVLQPRFPAAAAWFAPCKAVFLGLFWAFVLCDFQVVTTGGLAQHPVALLM